ncbi:TetR/AcrR family transcriptional regulator [Ruegeria marina]|uniref:Transcriptional regulator, TetR family n=1 Tax=Ruegeria marina TaxID=639004 RepID=A0A1G7E086_9RHOB|nr:TetR/AcrR family transcriptional regulator [Ruegeria marina]SDE56755.1 transcriptional regulator, TetR family [Ruegeria marina]
MARRRTAEDRKLQIVEAMLRLADEVGPDRITTSDVARAVGLTQPGIFRHFPTKQALWLAVAETVATRLTAAWDSAVAGVETPEKRLRALVLAQLRRIELCPALPSILFSREMQVENAELRAAFRDLLACFQGRLVAELRTMKSGGTIPPSLAAEDAAVFLTSLVQGLAIRWMLGNRSFHLVEEGGRLFDTQIAMMRRTPGGACSDQP